MSDIESIEDEAQLEQMLKKSRDFKEKDRIQAQLNAVRNKKNPGSVPTKAASNVTRSDSTVKDILLEWCKRQIQGYNHVDIKNFSTSWGDGMAFCALVHSLNPKAFDYSRLDPKRRRGNFRLAFDVAEKLLDISPLLEVDDMVRMKTPDWKCVFTYVQQFYKKQKQMQMQESKGKVVEEKTKE